MTDGKWPHREAGAPGASDDPSVHRDDEGSAPGGEGEREPGSVGDDPASAPEGQPSDAEHPDRDT